ncbi:MATE family efflux transporter [Neptunomonas japonica]|uniref:Multidrug-efflux transporter n=1 Tax=Neptunomonas japonica JAMM 1380 TaxID=1441457 RepID=A0A7R6PGK3_9GAMM|nr:MATE family efflux transporter [Neptunomonas japonica]BBB29228.1 multidrug resistance protein, MATE family [Neptunomonas japonica JAMM 1380]
MTLHRTWMEVKALLALGFPIMLTQIAQASMGFVDTLIAGQYNTLDLAAVALGSSIWLPIYLAATGILMATTPLVAFASGSNTTHGVLSIFRQGIWVAITLGIISVFILNSTTWILDFMGVETSLAAKTQEYLQAISWGFPALLIYQLLRSYFEGLGKTRPAMRIAFLALFLNIPLNYLFVFGKLSFPELGAAGCGWASALVMWVMLACGLAAIKRNPQLQLPNETNPRWLDTHELLNYLKLGIPMGFAILIETSMFSVIALLLAPLGTLVVSAHQITMTFSGLIFMIPLSIAMACTIRIGQLSGANEPKNAWFSAKTAILVTTSIAAFTSITIWLLATKIAQIFTSEPYLIELAASLLLIAALFEISDALQVTAAGALRGYKDTSIPLLIVFIAYWVIGLPLGYILGLTDLLLPAMGAAGFWYGLVIGLSVSAALLIVRLKRVAQHAHI